MPKLNLKEISSSINIAEKLTEKELANIGQLVLEGYEEDYQSNAEWLSDVKRVLKLTTLKTETKNYPLPTSANVKFPIITKAAYEFSSRTYPEIIKDGKLVKGRVIGKDDEDSSKSKQAMRVAEYMNYQLMFQDSSWELELDRKLHLLALIGFLCKKTYYDPVVKKIKSEICEYEDLIINSSVSNLDDAQRINHVLHVSLNDLVSKSRYGVFCEEPIQELIDKYADVNLIPTIDLIEQHCFLDLDDDDLKEPYIVTVLKENGQVLRIVARYTEDMIQTKNDKVCHIEALQLFTDYHFLPSPTGKFQSLGFGILMLHLNESINTILNQLLDAGQLANLKGGYIDSRFKVIESGNNLFDPGEFKKIKGPGTGNSLKDAILPITYGEPSSVLYQLLGLLIDAARDLSSTTDIMSGNTNLSNAKSGAVMAMVEQGLKVFTAIQRRIYRSLSNEYRKIFILNKLYLPPSEYVNVLDDTLAIKQKDFDDLTVNIIPVADPNLSSETTRFTQAQFLMSIITAPGIDPVKVTQRVLESTNIPNPEGLLLSEEQQNQPNLEVIQVQADLNERAEKLQIEGRKQALAEKQFILDVLKTEADILLTRAQSMKAVAEADAASQGVVNDEYDLQLRAIQTHLDSLLNINSLNLDKAEEAYKAIQEQQKQEQAQEPQQSVEEPINESAPDPGLEEPPSQ